MGVILPDLIWAYVLAITLLTISPGADTLLVVRNTARGGTVDGCVTSLGICLGLFFHATLSALGISMLLLKTEWAFVALKWAGALYLVWLGLGSLRRAVAGTREQSPEAAAVRYLPAGYLQSLREGLLSNLLNPKTGLFYMALLPQFIDPAGSAFAQSMVLALLHFVLAMLWQCALAWVVARFRGAGIGERLKRLLNTLTGGVFVVLGAKLALG